MWFAKWLFFMTSLVFQTFTDYQTSPLKPPPPNSDKKNHATQPEPFIEQINSIEQDNDLLSVSDEYKQSDEVKTLFIDQIESKINDFKDLKTQAAVLDRHLRKHSNSGDFNNTRNMPTDLEFDTIKPYEDELKTLRNKIIESNHEIDVESVLMVNKKVDHAETFLETSRERVYGALDAHLASDEHKNEHAHHGDGGNGHSEDHLSDYADLISVETEVAIEDEDLLIEYIDMEIDEFENIKEQKYKLANHIQDHWNNDHVDPDELQLKIAENVLQELNSQDLKSYEDSLLALKKQIKESHGKLKLETIDQIASTMEKAEVFRETSNDKLELVSLLDEEFEEIEEIERKSPSANELDENRKMGHEDDGHFLTASPVEAESNVHIVNVEQYSTEVKEALRKAAEDSHQFLHDKKLAHHAHVQKEAVQVEDIPLTTTFTLTILFMVMLAIVVAVLMCISKKKSKKDDVCETGCDTLVSSLGVIGKTVKSPQLVLEKELEGRMSRRRRR